MLSHITDRQVSAEEREKENATLQDAYCSSAHGRTGRNRVCAADGAGSGIARSDRMESAADGGRRDHGNTLRGSHEGRRVRDAHEVPGRDEGHAAYASRRVAHRRGSVGNTLLWTRRTVGRSQAQAIPRRHFLFRAEEYAALRLGQGWRGDRPGYGHGSDGNDGPAKEVASGVAPHSAPHLAAASGGIAVVAASVAGFGPNAWP